MTKEKEKALYPKTIEFSNGLYGQKINQNTLYVTGYPSHCSLEQLLWTIPPKIKTRVVINVSELNHLPTIIVQSESVANLTQEALIQMLEYSNTLNAQIGLPETQDLIIRSAEKKTFRTGKRSRSPKFSEPAILLQNLGRSNSKYKLLEKAGLGTNPISFEEFVEAIGTQTFLLIHPDHDKLQTEGLHGALVVNDAGCELACATGVPHARNLVDSKLDAPVIRISSNHLEDIFQIDPFFAAVAIQKGIGKSFRGIPEIYSLNNQSPKEGLRVFKIAQKNAAYILNTYQKVIDIFGEEAVMEFRIYPGESIRSPLHVLDVNKKF